MNAVRVAERSKSGTPRAGGGRGRGGGVGGGGARSHRRLAGDQQADQGDERGPGGGAVEIGDALVGRALAAGLVDELLDYPVVSPAGVDPGEVDALDPVHLRFRSVAGGAPAYVGRLPAVLAGPLEEHVG